MEKGQKSIPSESARSFVSTEFSNGITSFFDVKEDKTSPRLQQHLRYNNMLAKEISNTNSIFFSLYLLKTVRE